MLQLFSDLCYYIGAIRKMGGYQRVKMSRRLSEGIIIVRGGCANVWRGDNNNNNNNNNTTFI